MTPTPPTDAEVERVAEQTYELFNKPFLWRVCSGATREHYVNCARWHLAQLRASQPPQVGSQEVEASMEWLRMHGNDCDCSEYARAHIKTILTALHQANERIVELGKDKERLDFLQKAITKDEIQDDKLASKTFHETKDLRLSIDAAMSVALSKEPKGNV